MVLVVVPGVWRFACSNACWPISHGLIRDGPAESLPLPPTIFAVSHDFLPHRSDECDMAFYVSKLGSELEQRFGPAFAILVHDDLTLWLAGPNASASRPTADGARPSPGGWSRFVLVVDDL